MPSFTIRLFREMPQELEQDIIADSAEHARYLVQEMIDAGDYADEDWTNIDHDEPQTTIEHTTEHGLTLSERIAFEEAQERILDAAAEIRGQGVDEPAQA